VGGGPVAVAEWSKAWTVGQELPQCQ
jgi:hypothetical protein